MIDFFGYDFGLAGSDGSTGQGPMVLKRSKFSDDLTFPHTWHEVNFQPKAENICKQLEIYSRSFRASLAKSNNKFCVFGGDHTSAISTIQATKARHDKLKLIWVDAHMDLHTMASSHSKNIHGMSLAVLLGQADPPLQSLHDPCLSLLPQDVCLFGIRSYEPEEKLRLEQLGINIIYMSDILADGVLSSWQKALSSLSLTTDAALVFSIDLDAFDPKFAPGVTVPEANGLDSNEFALALSATKSIWQKHLVGNEIVEFSPVNDNDRTTERLVFNLVNNLWGS